ncbi:MAG TPA: glycosyltransferase family 4 protein [Candidatus Saccharimonadales bacterium]
MRIALLSPFEEPVPPKMYGGTERIVYTLAEEWVAMGHDVTLYASGDSQTAAKLIPCTPRAVRVLPEARNPLTRQALNLHALATALQDIRDTRYDIIHNHFGWQTLLFNAFLNWPMVTTLHGTLDKALMPTEHKMHNYFREAPFVSISNSQRRHSPKLNYVETVYHGIYPDEFEYNDKPDDYLAFLGRIHPQKGPVHAIRLAKKTGQKLIIAAKVDPAEFHYFGKRIKPLIDGKQIVYIGEVGHEEKVKLLKNAKALLSPLQWDEPFGIVNVESMACGTPVITARRGSMPEIIVEGKTGFLCRNSKEMEAAIGNIGQLDRRACREHVENNFTARKMAENYIKAFTKVIKERKLKGNTV